MESVYKLSKYSQKIDEACRAKQLDKVMEYNQHELAHINKLSKYFGNQKGGATVEKVVEAVSRLVQEVVNGKDAKMNEFLQEIDNAVELKEGKAVSLRTQPLTTDVILQKVGALKIQASKAQEHINHVRELQGRLDRIVEDNRGKILSAQSQYDEMYKLYEKSKVDIAQAQRQAQALQERLDAVSAEAITESRAKEKAQNELAEAEARVKAQAAELAQTTAVLKEAQKQLQARGGSKKRT
jgi:hypothetical protein